jgi:hypothetical protein
MARDWRSAPMIFHIDIDPRNGGADFLVELEAEIATTSACRRGNLSVGIKSDGRGITIVDAD